jgi:ribonucleoside-triphosphate reductase
LLPQGGELFGSSSFTGSIGVVTINIPRLGFLSDNEYDFFEKFGKIMNLAKESLKIKRKTLESFTN